MTTLELAKIHADKYSNFLVTDSVNYRANNRIEILEFTLDVPVTVSEQEIHETLTYTVTTGYGGTSCSSMVGFPPSEQEGQRKVLVAVVKM